LLAAVAAVVVAVQALVLGVAVVAALSLNQQMFLLIQCLLMCWLAVEGLAVTQHLL